MKSWQKVLLNPSSAISKAIQILDKEAQKIVLVVDESKKLLGTITDGDIRRALLKGCVLSDSIDKVMYRKARVATTNESRKQIQARMEKLKLMQMPIVDNNMVVHGLEVQRPFTEKQRLNNPVFIMAGGFGKRLRPLTEEVPKPMLKVGSKPILETIIEEFISSGFVQFYISVHYKAEMIKEHFGNGKQWGVNINYVHEEKPLGTAGALGLLPKKISDLPLVLMNGDLLTKVNFEELLSFHQEQGGIATMCVRKCDFRVPYGVVQKDGYRIKSIVEKPVQSFFVNAGIYILNHNLVKMIEKNSYLDMPNLLENCIEKHEQVNMFPIHEYWMDIGQIEEYERAQTDIGGVFSQ
jgi:dTDP-glucose pyrophosphorylase